MPPPPTLPAPLPAERRQFLASLLDVSVRQLAWREDAEWEAPSGDEPDPDDEIATFRNKCTVSDGCVPVHALIDLDVSIIYRIHRQHR